ncbi:MAG: HAD hydrolase-like protein, partial [Clostridia bacterium]|nr:HAD hydrolase-like protein [Clostridia bacterium]
MKQSKIKAVMFDLDGTLLDTLDDLAAAVNHALSVRGCPGRTRDEVRAFVGNGIGKLLERSVPDGTSPEEMLCPLCSCVFSASPTVCFVCSSPFSKQSENRKVLL